MTNKLKELIPLFQNEIPAGFPSPADDYIENQLDLHQFLVPHPSATFFLKVQGESMQNAGIFSGDIIIVDRSLEARPGNVIVAILNGEFTVKRFVKRSQKVILVPENSRYEPIVIEDNMDFQIWGVVTYVIHKV